ncbi:MAG: hypothetical protein H7A36_02200 [Chlamydiales bacterium]|nr:hypothetical protein [Chlamydiales bacterium]
MTEALFSFPTTPDSPTIKVTVEPTDTIERVKEAAYNSFWAGFSGPRPQHGTWESLVFQQEGVEVTTMSDLHSRLALNPNFQVLINRAVHKKAA